MQVNVKLYGPFSLMSGRDDFVIMVDEEAISVKDFLSLLSRKIPQFSRSLNSTDTEQFLKQRILLVINGTPCFEKLKLIHDGDQIQILTPVIGG